MKRFPFFRQLDANDCGPTCIRMICAYYHNECSIEKLRELCHITRVGITIRDLTDALIQLGFKNFVVKIRPEEVMQMPIPSILYWQQKHFVVLFKLKRVGENVEFHIADPEYGKIKLAREEFENVFSSKKGDKGVAIVLEPTVDFYKRKEQKSFREYFRKTIRPIQNMLFPYRKKFILSIVLALVASATNWAMPILFQHIIDDGIGKRDINAIYLLGIAQFVFFLSYVISDTISNILLTKSSFKIGISFLTNYLHKLIKLPIRFFDAKANSDLIQLIDDQEKLKSFLAYNFIGTLLAVCNLIIFSAIIIYYNYLIYLIFLGFALLSILWSLHYLNKKHDINYKRFSLYSEGKSRIYELIMGMREIKINSAQEKKVREVENIQDRINLFQLKDLYLNYYSNIGISSFNKMKDILIIIFCASLVIQGKQTVGELMSISYLLGQLTIPLAQLLNFALNAQDAKLSFDRLQNIQMTLEENNDRKDFLLNNLATGIQLKNIWFKYIGTYSPFVLKGISFYIPKGKVTAIVGSSGSGKTTLLKLLLNFYNPNEGEITINDTLFSEISPDAWRRKCGVIMQDGYMFSGTILDNIAISDEQVDEAKVIQSARIACIHDFIESLPLKYNTNIGNMGIELSGGQKQRILIARAIYKNPEFIFLDEATSFLDADNETRIMAYLNKFFIGKTVVIIAHRLSTVKTADNIVVLEKGVIVEQGTHNHLIMSQGRYYQLIRNQLELGN